MFLQSLSTDMLLVNEIIEIKFFFVGFRKAKSGNNSAILSYFYAKSGK